MVGKIFGIMVLTSFVISSTSGNISVMSDAAVSGAAEAIRLSISMMGIMCLWNGIIRVFDKAGLTKNISRLIYPILKIIYPSAYSRGVSLDSVAANFSANLLGLGNAALPLGIRAICDLKGDNKDIANDDMIMFSVLNTTPLQLIPTTLIALRSAHASSNPFEIILPIWICSLLTTVFGIILCKIMSKTKLFRYKL